MGKVQDWKGEIFPGLWQCLSDLFWVTLSSDFQEIYYKDAAYTTVRLPVPCSCAFGAHLLSICVLSITSSYLVPTCPRVHTAQCTCGTQRTTHSGNRFFSFLLKLGVTTYALNSGSVTHPQLIRIVKLKVEIRKEYLFSVATLRRGRKGTSHFSLSQTEIPGEKSPFI